MLSDIYLKARRATFTWVDPARFLLEDFATHSKGESIFVCEDAGGTIAGFIAILNADAFIHMLYISAGWQGAGAGTALLQALPGWPRRRYRLKCLVKNKAARRFYEQRGFVVTGLGTSAEGDYNDMVFRPVTDWNL
ncbi:GNAT family N-acetyltransferase [Rhizobium tumorigenes]|uniref:GNAT family N-acetyltransferase n=1 Tax=Rhizobium tumorigenes TaxID=2041385 RepID=A0AAF1KSC9_9HYPH|nr:GNAT family N-acetyltransferase [Rhizobium tumorigenes]WFR97358.1 GNAT family N-acetyltransferase [Rhizobium tumorigenes]